MTATKRRLLELLVTMDEVDATPVEPNRLAERLDTDVETTLAHLQSLESYELVKRQPPNGGYRPTVTAHELLALDIDDTFLIIETSGSTRHSRQSSRCRDHPAGDRGY